VIAGRPEWGVDMDENTLAQEANMDALQAISYKKGCYTGQETVARVHFRGHVNRTLRRVRHADGTEPAIGTALASHDGSVVGDTRSSALDDQGQRIGIAMVRREVGDAAVLRWTGDDASTHDVIVTGVADE
jgi:folate-binding protein YgfZ